MDTRAVLVAAAWAERDAARAEYRALKQKARDEGASRRAAGRSRTAAGARHRVERAWLWLYELGEVPLAPRQRDASE